MVSLKFEMPTEEELALRSRLLRDPESAKAFREAREAANPKPKPKREPRILPDLTKQSDDT